MADIFGCSLGERKGRTRPTMTLANEENKSSREMSKYLSYYVQICKKAMINQEQRTPFSIFQAVSESIIIFISYYLMIYFFQVGDSISSKTFKLILKLFRLSLAFVLASNDVSSIIIWILTTLSK